MILDQFINAKWHTVPMSGELRRTPTGSKTGFSFPPNWRDKYSTEFNTNTTPLAGAITGKISGIVAIDCDSQATLDMFQQLDTRANLCFLSKGKDKGGGTIIYKYTDEIKSFQLQDDNIHLDYFADYGFIFLPTEHNFTKEPWTYTEVPELNEMPTTIVMLLKSLSSKTLPEKPKDAEYAAPKIGNRLSPMLSYFLDTKEYQPTLFKILTPKSFRDLPKYIAQGHLHPKDVPEGRGSEYLSKISAILGADISVNIEQYLETMSAINRLWNNPLPLDRLESTITHPMVSGKVTINGESVWQHDEQWDKTGLVATTMRGDYIECFFDDIKNLYYIVNHTANHIANWGVKKPCIDTFTAQTGIPMTIKQFDRMKQLRVTVQDPSKEFGIIAGTDKFNIFKQSEELRILNYPDLYQKQYKRPVTTLKFLESLIPDDYMREYVLGFIYKKFTTFKYSSVILYFIGTQGSGKDTFVKLLTDIIGNSYVEKPKAKVLLEKHNGWIEGKYLIQLDEYGNSLNNISDRNEVLSIIKAYSGSRFTQIRRMRTDAYNYYFTGTFILTANSNPLPLETDDRRMAYIDTPFRLDKLDWVIESGGIYKIYNQIFAELKDFCYYLAVEAKRLTDDEYLNAPITSGKEKLILGGLPPADRIAYMLHKSMFKELEELFLDHDIDKYYEGWSHNRVSYSKIYDLYMRMTNDNGTTTIMLRSFKKLNIERFKTTYKNELYYYYSIPGIHKYSHKQEEQFTKEENGFMGL